jgi:hypothetical protein
LNRSGLRLARGEMSSGRAEGGHRP